MEEVRYRFDKNYFDCESIFALYRVVPGVLLAWFYNFPEETEMFWRVGSLLVFVLYAVWRYSTTRFERNTSEPAIILSPAGITDNTRRNSRGFVPWSGIEAISKMKSGALSLSILDKNEEYRRNLKDFLLSNEKYGPGILIPLSAIDSEEDEIERQILRFMPASQEAQPPG